MKLRIIAIGIIALVLIIGTIFGLTHNNALAKEIEWQSFADGIARGKFEKKKVFLHFYADWCAACKIMEEKTFKDAGVIAFLNENFIPIKVNVDREKETSTMFRVRVLPDTFFMTENNEVIGHRPGFISPEQLKTILKMVRDGQTGQ